MVSKETKLKAAAAITDKGVSFNVGEHEFCIRKLVLGSLELISAQQLLLDDATVKTKETDVIRSMAKDARIKARIIAIAIINCQPIPERPKKPLFSFRKEHFDPKFLDENELTEYFMKRLTSEELETLVNVVKERMDIEPFFRSTVSLRGIDLLKETSKTVSDQLTVSGEE